MFTHIQYPAVIPLKRETTLHRYQYAMCRVRAPIIFCPVCMILVRGPVIVPHEAQMHTYSELIGKLHLLVLDEI